MHNKRLPTCFAALAVFTVIACGEDAETPGKIQAPDITGWDGGATDSSVGADTVAVSDAGPVAVSDAGSVAVSDAGSVAVSDAGSVAVSDAGSVAVSDAGSAQDAGTVKPPAKKLRFALIGDYGVDNKNEAAVAKLVKSWKPEFIITVGDNNYDVGSAATIDKNIGKYYGEFIKPYKGKYGPGSPDINRFWPSPGNHDWLTKGLKPYLDYFTLPHNERYYDFVRGPVHFLSIDSDSKEPDSNKWGGKQAKWIAARAKAVDKPYTIAYFHHPPYNSGSHGPTTAMRWGWKSMGVSITLAGHDHSYERGRVGGVWHIVQGIGGRSLYKPGTKISPGSQVRVHYRFGATLIEADNRLAAFTTIDTHGNVLDQAHLAPKGKAVSITGTKVLIPKGAVWKYNDKGQDLGKGWRSIGYGDALWKSGPAKLGYGDKDVKTTISYGGKANKKHLTAYFRRAFTVADPSIHKTLQIALRRDDGAVVYINGKEVMRSNMPPGAIAFTTKAGNQTGAESAFHSKTIAADVLVKGKNVVAVEVHQISQSSSDLGFDFELKGPVADGKVVFGFGSKWNFYDKGAAPAGWTSPQPGGSWNAGGGPFGYGQGGLKTTIGYGSDQNAKHMASYFRKVFNVSDASKIDYGHLRLKRDDGVVVYVNGAEVWRINMPVGKVGPTTKAGYTVSGQQEYDVIETLFDGKHLKSGDNVIAVEVHQSAANSSDLFFDLALATFAK